MKKYLVFLSTAIAAMSFFLPQGMFLGTLLTFMGVLAVISLVCQSLCVAFLKIVLHSNNLDEYLENKDQEELKDLVARWNKEMSGMLNKSWHKYMSLVCQLVWIAAFIYATWYFMAGVMIFCMLLSIPFRKQLDKVDQKLNCSLTEKSV